MIQIERYDVVVAGASFAGLAVASKLDGLSVLLIDRADIGMHQTSSCGTRVGIVEALGCKKSILQEFDTIAIHVKQKEFEINVPIEYCTVDYAEFCRSLNKRNDAEFIKAQVKGVSNGRVITNKGMFVGKVTVDCTGWQAVLASSVDKSYVDRTMLAFGIETELPYQDDLMRFFIDPAIIKNGLAWLFPCGDNARFGVGCYAPNTRILPCLERLLAHYGLEADMFRGGYFCYKLKRPFVDRMFVAGCAAGHTLPLTGEGIHRTLRFGLLCGDFVRKVCEGKLSTKDAQRRYAKATLKHKLRYRCLLNAQKIMPATPKFLVAALVKLLTFNNVARLAWGMLV